MSTTPGAPNPGPSPPSRGDGPDPVPTGGPFVAAARPWRATIPLAAGALLLAFAVLAATLALLVRDPSTPAGAGSRTPAPDAPTPDATPATAPGATTPDATTPDAGPPQPTPSAAPLESRAAPPGDDERMARAAEREARWADASRGWAAVHARTSDRRHLEKLLVSSLVALRDALEADRPDDGLALVESLLLPRREHDRARETLATAYRRLFVHQVQAVRLASARDIARRLGELGPPWDADARALLASLAE